MTEDTMNTSRNHPASPNRKSKRDMMMENQKKFGEQKSRDRWKEMTKESKTTKKIDENRRTEKKFDKICRSDKIVAENRDG